MSFDLLLKNAHVVDPAHHRDGHYDLGIARGTVARVAPDLSPTSAARTWDLSGKVVAPGLVDIHMHSTLGPGGEAAFAMLARGGVATAVDFAGPPAQVLDLVARHGSGITVGSLQVLRPAVDKQPHTFADDPDTAFATDDPDAGQIRHAIGRGLQVGAIGTKILGGHFPLSPDATQRIIDESTALGIYIALHVGTTATGSNLNGLTEAVQMATPTRRVHVCHINSALRGQVLPSRLTEAAQAMTVLDEAGDAVVSESFLTRWSPDPGLCIGGVPDSAIVRTSLEVGGYEPTQAGLAQAIADGYTVVIVPRGDTNVAVGGDVGLRYWQQTGTAASIAFPISYADVGLICATHKRRDGQFTVTALASDAGLLPFNVTLDHGLLLVRFGALTLSELMHKAAFAPARMLGLTTKGHLGEGADADIVVIDVERQRASHLFVAGELVMADGLVLGQGGTFLTTEAGVAAVTAHGLPSRLVDLSQSMLYQPSRPPRSS